MKKDIVFTILEQMLAHSPEASYGRLNGALSSTLTSCIQADLLFQPDTFKRIYHELRGGRWFGDGAGSADGEHFYTTACGANHASAQQSFERFAERPGVLWEEDAAQPKRLHVGAQFTWKGRFVTVTSMHKDSLVACAYGDYPSEVRGLKPGTEIGYSPTLVVTSVKKDGAATILRCVKAPQGHGERTVTRRFTIEYSDITELRRSAKKRVKTILDMIADCNPAKDTAKLAKAVQAGNFRHFELEEINAAIARHKNLFAQADAIQAWRDGRNGEWLNSELILLRVIEDRVECSNGNSISKATAARALPVLLENRKKTLSLDIPLDSYTLEHISPAGVKIGCTLVSWDEIDRITPSLQTA